jgi:hypothetical protein
MHDASMVQGLSTNGSKLRVREPPSCSLRLGSSPNALSHPNQGPCMADILPLAYSSHARWRLSWREDRLTRTLPSPLLKRVPRVRASKRHRRSHRYPAISLPARAPRPPCEDVCVFGCAPSQAVRSIISFIGGYVSTRECINHDRAAPRYTHMESHRSPECQRRSTKDQPLSITHRRNMVRQR